MLTYLFFVQLVLVGQLMEHYIICYTHDTISVKRTVIQNVKPKKEDWGTYSHFEELDTTSNMV